MGIRSLAADVGITFDIVLGTDASAALGIVTRRGVGKTRHIDVAGCNTTSRIGSTEGRRRGERCGHNREERENQRRSRRTWRTGIHQDNKMRHGRRVDGCTCADQQPVRHCSEEDPCRAESGGSNVQRKRQHRRQQQRQDGLTGSPRGSTTSW